MEKGDRVIVTDGSYAVRVDSYEEYTSIGLRDDVFEVTKYKYDGRLKSGFDTTVHDIFIKNTRTGRIYLHSKAFVRIVAAKPKVDPGLIEALKLSIQQWQIMYDTGKDKEEVYKFLCGNNDNFTACFLCKAVRTEYTTTADCVNCIGWGVKGNCLSKGSPYAGHGNNSKAAQIRMLNHLKSELSRLEFLSK